MKLSDLEQCLDYRVPQIALSKRYRCIQSPTDMLFNFIMFNRHPFIDSRWNNSKRQQATALRRNYWPFDFD